ncbi:MAG TPA: hypothetical protein VHJ34_06755 [Actinomycetota bacterium]|nr:hypothetical protein [Actinomycetota bacterium]
MRKLLTALAACALVLSACADDGPSAEENPKDAVTNALDNLSQAEGMTVTVSLAADASQLVELSEGEISEEQANQIVESSITFAGNNAENVEDSQAEITADVAGVDNAVELRVVGSTLYARAEVEALADTFGADTSQLDAVAQQASAQGMDFVEPALQGEWIGLEGLDQLSQAAGVSQELTAQQRKLQNELVDALERSSRMSFEGSDDVGDHVVATISLRDAYEGFAEAMQSLGQAGAQMPPTSQVPDEDVSVDLWVDGDQLTQIELDVLQFARFADEPVDVPDGRIALRLALEEGEVSVEAPEDAVTVDVQQLMQGFLGGMGTETDTGTEPAEGDGGGAGGTEAICRQIADQLKGQPKATVQQAIEQLRDQCPDLESQISG